MKRVAMGLALALAVSAYADQHAKTINKTGFVGVNKTQSAQSLGHSKLVFNALGDYAFGNKMFQPEAYYGYTLERTFDETQTPGAWKQRADVGNYNGVSAYVGFAIGLLDYFDLGVTLPVFYDQFKGPTMCGGEANCNPEDLYGTKKGYVGNLTANLKMRAPIPSDIPVDFAAFFRYSFATSKKTEQGLWIREPEFIGNKGEVAGKAYPFGANKSDFTAGAALTLDLSKVDVMPLLLHINGGYRLSMNKDYLSFPFGSAAIEIYPLDFLSLFAEFYMDYQDKNFEMKTPAGQTLEEKLDMKQVTGGLVFHLPVGLDIQLGGSMYVGNDNYIHFVEVLENQDKAKTVATKIRVNPQYALFGGLTWSGFLLPQDRDGDGVSDADDRCPDDYGHRLNAGCPMGNPDSDEDGVCDAWVSEKGMLDEFRNVCEGIDQCPDG